MDGVGIDERPWTCDSFVFHSSTKPRNYGDAKLEHTAHTCLFDDNLGRGDACKTTFDFLHKNDLAAWPWHDSCPTTTSPSYIGRLSEASAATAPLGKFDRLQENLRGSSLSLQIGTRDHATLN